MATSTEFKAIVTGNASQELEKTFANGAKGISVLQNCKITEGPLKGTIVSGTRTLLNKEGKTKEAVPVGTEVKLYLTRVASTTQPGGYMNFFEISTGLSASQDEINRLLNATVGEAVENQLQSQQV